MIFTEKIGNNVLLAFKNRGIDENNFITVIHADLDGNGNYFHTYLALEKDILHILSGRDVTIRENKKIKDEFIYENYESFKLSDIKDVIVERCISTGRVVIEKEDGELVCICRFSIGQSFKFDKLCDYLKKTKEQSPIIENDEAYEPFCPKCGKPYIDAKRKICRNCIDRGSVMRRLLQMINDYKKQVIFVMSVIILSAVLSIIAPYFSSKIFYDEVLKQGGKYYGQLLTVILMVFSFGLLSVVTNAIYGVVISSMMAQIIHSLRLRVFSALQRLSLGFFTSKQTGSLMSRVNDDTANVYYFFIDIVPYAIVNFIKLFGVLAIMFSINFYLSLIILFATVIVLGLSSNFYNKLKKLYRKRHLANRRMNATVSDSLSGQRVVKSFAKEEQEKNRFFGRSQTLYNVDVDINIKTSTNFPLFWYFYRLAIILVWGIGGYIIMTGNKLEFGDLMALIAYSGLIIEPIDFLMWMSDRLTRCVVSAMRVFEIMDAIPSVREDENPVLLENTKGEIKLENVKFEYETGRPIIKDLSFTVKSGQMFGIVGKTGAGKTTIIDLISRLYDVNDGAIYLDGVNIKNIAFKSLREKIGIVSQEGYIFVGTILENINFSKPDASMDEIINAAKAADAHDFIMRQKNGYDTHVGSGGTSLSGGERQRISIARAILQDPAILILDEATAAMDTQTEARIMAALDKLKFGRTIISIAHRLSTLKDADILAVIKNGEIAEIGTHSELITKKGEYFELYKVQSEALKKISIGD